jgi:hypothetical protein
MSTDLVNAWERFTHVLKIYNAHLLLNPPCTAEHIQEVDRKFNFDFPSPLKSLLALNDGQQIDDEGIKKGVFKSVSGWNVYQRHVFLSGEEIRKAYESFINDEALVEEFGKKEIPFAIAPSPIPYSQIQYREAFCVNSSTGIVSLIWTQHIDPMDPPEWQIAKFKRAESLTEFIEKQIEYYW